MPRVPSSSPTSGSIPSPVNSRPSTPLPVGSAATWSPWAITSPRASRPSDVSALQLDPVAVAVQRLRVGQGFGIVHRLAVHHIAHGQLHYLAAAGTRYVLHRNDACRHMPWAGVLADLLADAPLQRG